VSARDRCRVSDQETLEGVGASLIHFLVFRPSASARDCDSSCKSNKFEQVYRR
jgi:hypothetical protein